MLNTNELDFDEFDGIIENIGQMVDKEQVEKKQTLLERFNGNQEKLLGRFIKKYKEKKILSDGTKVALDELGDLYKTRKKQTDSAKKTISDFMNLFGIKKLDTVDGKLSFRESAALIVSNDNEDIPEDYKTIEEKVIVDEKTIKSKLMEYRKVEKEFEKQLEKGKISQKDFFIEMEMLANKRLEDIPFASLDIRQNVQVK